MKFLIRFITRKRTKKEELLLASRIIWNIGTLLTAQYVLSANKLLDIYYYPLVLIICYSVQYPVTKIESALFSGAIPSPWNSKRTTKTISIWLGAATITLLDIFVNIGGVGYVSKFIKDSASGDILKSEFGASDNGLKVVTSFMIIALALLVAIGPELLKMYAEMLETSDEELIDIIPFEEKPIVRPYVEKLPTNNLTPEVNESLVAARIAAIKNKQAAQTIPLPSRRKQ